jgi:hypothetical protein
MASITTQRARPRGPRLFEGPTLFSRTRRDIAELVGWTWLVIEIVRLLRSRFEQPTPASPRWDHADSRYPPQDRRKWDGNRTT